MDAAERKARQDELKKAAAEKALEWLTPGQVVGVGSGSTVGFFIEARGRHRQAMAAPRPMRLLPTTRSPMVPSFRVLPYKALR